MAPAEVRGLGPAADRPLDRAIGTTNILLVEDNPAHARLVSELLADAGADFHLEHRTSLAAVRDVDAAAADCVLLDLSLPDAVGVEALRALWGIRPQVPVVVLSGRIDEDEALACVRQGAQDYLPKAGLGAALLSRSLSYAIERKRLESELAYQALHDALTGLPNRSLFMDRVERALLRSRRGRGAVAVLFVDLDGFKAINDGHGHAMGDRMLRSIGERLQGTLRPEDTLARLGGDEFCVLCADLGGVADAVVIVRRLEQALDSPLTLGEQSVFMTASIGVAISPAGARCVDAEALLRLADAAMYRAKRSGKDRFEILLPGDSVDLSDPSGESALRAGIENRELRLHYQPIFAVEDGRLVGAEALVRWQHPTRGLLNPQEFVPLAERTGLVVSLGAWVLDEACRQTQRWRQELGREMTVCVNLSAAQLAHHDLAAAVAKSLRATGLAADSLTLEVTETAVMSDVESCLATLDGLRSIGVGLSIDDFGTGYSSLAYLCRLPASVVKVDRSFVSALGDRDAGEHHVVAAVVDLAHRLDKTVVAEGVETAEQLDALQRLGCDEAQGFLLGRPVPADAFEQAFLVPTG